MGDNCSILLTYHHTISHNDLFMFSTVYRFNIGHYYVQRSSFPTDSRRPWKILRICFRPSRQFSMFRFYFAFQYRHPSGRNTFHKQHLALNKTLTLECHPRNILKLPVYSFRYANAHCPVQYEN